MNKIMINGRACSGKDAFANYLVEEYGYTKISFASPIYQICHDYFGMTIKDRWLLQSVGEKLREIDPDVWVKVAFKTAENYHRVVISDVRRENEYKYGIKCGYTPFRIRADLDVRISRCIERDGLYPDIEEWEKETETGADHFAYHEVLNNGTLQELHKLIDYLMEKGANA